MRMRLILAAALVASHAGAQTAPGLRAGTAKVEVTDRSAGPVNDPSYAKALVIANGAATAVLVTVDAVAIGEIGRIGSGFMASVREQLRRDPGIQPANIIVNASHCHSVVRRDADALAVQAVRQAWRNMVPVRAGAGRGREDGIMENRRMRLKDGTQADVRRAYSMPRDEDVASTGPVDPEIGLLRLDRLDGTTLAVVYNFAAHPIEGVPNGGNTADYPGFASRAIEENLPGAMALFIQGSAGDINPAKYKDVHAPHDAEALGNRLGLSVLRAVRGIRTRDGAPLRVINEPLAVPRGDDRIRRIAAIRDEQAKLLKSLAGTSLNFKTFLPLYVQYSVSGEYPSHYAHRYLHEKEQGREDLTVLDSENRANMDAYLRNIQAMEQLTRLQINLALLEQHQARVVEAGGRPLDTEVVGLRVGDFTLVTFPGELTVEIGLGIKRRAPGPYSFVAGYTNGYVFYTATAAQRNNTGYAQEDCDAMVGPEWQKLFEDRANDVLRRLWHN